VKLIKTFIFKEIPQNSNLNKILFLIVGRDFKNIIKLKKIDNLFYYFLLDYILIL